MVFACHAITASAVATAMMPCIWFFAIPLAAAGAAMAVYLQKNYRTRGSIVACVVLSVLVLIAGLIRGEEVNRLLHELDDRPQPRRR
jgi:ABC-type enterochelin transport system permease subunit